MADSDTDPTWLDRAREVFDFKDKAVTGVTEWEVKLAQTYTIIDLAQSARLLLEEMRKPHLTEAQLAARATIANSREAKAFLGLPLDEEVP